MNTHKVCTRCKQRKPITAFNKRAKARDGLRQTCKGCDGEIRRNWQAGQRAMEAPLLATGLGPDTAPVTVTPKEAGALPPGSVGVPARKTPVEGGGMAPAPGPPGPGAQAEPGGKVIGRIGGPAPPGTVIREVVTDPLEEQEKALAREYANLLNKKLSIRQRANLMVKIAKQSQGPTAALALAALRDINAATGITSRQGSVIDSGHIFVMPEGTSKMKMGSGNE